MHGPIGGRNLLPLPPTRTFATPATRHSAIIPIDADLAFLYGVSTKALNQQVKRNPLRYPPDFVFRLTILIF